MQWKDEEYVCHVCLRAHSLYAFLFASYFMDLYIKNVPFWLTMKHSYKNDLIANNVMTRTLWLEEEVQQDRLRMIRQFLGECQDDCVLDVGCGDITPLLVSNTEKTIGLDVSKISLQVLKSSEFRGGLILASAIRLPFRDNVFQKAICSEVIEHLQTNSQTKKCIEELYRVAKQFLITTPNYGFGSDWYAFSHPDHRRVFSVKKLKKLLQPNTIYLTSTVKGLLPYFIPSSSTKPPLFLVAIRHSYPSRSKLFSTFIFVHKHFMYIDSRLGETRLGKLLLKLKRKTFGGALIFAVAKKRSK